MRSQIFCCDGILWEWWNSHIQSVKVEADIKTHKAPVSPCFPGSQHLRGASTRYILDNLVHTQSFPGFIASKSITLKILLLYWSDYTVLVNSQIFGTCFFSDNTHQNLLPPFSICTSLDIMFIFSNFSSQQGAIYHWFTRTNQFTRTTNVIWRQHKKNSN